MVKINKYKWIEGATLDDHSKKKHLIISEYLRKYLLTRCQLPQQEKFRLIFVDAFSGSGLYSCGSLGSPLLFVDTLCQAIQEMNLSRLNNKLKPVLVDATLIMNDISTDAIEILRKNIAPYQVQAIETPNLKLSTVFFNESFQDVYPKIKSYINSQRCNNVLINLDQYGYSDVTTEHIKDMCSSWRSTEVILTFMIESVITYLSPNKEKAKGIALETDLKNAIFNLLEDNSSPLNKKQWLGEVEKLVYESFFKCAKFVSPFCINNPKGWRYWLMHFSNEPRARQVYNNILHQEAGMQAHFGRSGLRMLSYDPSEEANLYIFDQNSRKNAKNDLYDDIPRLITSMGRELDVNTFYNSVYSQTPAHSDDIHEMIIANPDLEVITHKGGNRRKSNTISAKDTIRVKSQTSMFFMSGD